MKKLFRFVGNAIWNILQFILAVGITVLILSVVPVIIILLTGLVGLAFAAQISFMTILNSPFYGFALAAVFLMGVVVITILAIAFLILALIFIVSFTAFPISLLVQEKLRQSEIKSWLSHILIYSLFGGLTGVLLGLLPILATWQSLNESQYPALVIASIMIVSILSGMLSVNICGVTLSTTTKIRKFFLKIISGTKPKLITAQNVL